MLKDLKKVIIKFIITTVIFSISGLISLLVFLTSISTALNGKNALVAPIIGLIAIVIMNLALTIILLYYFVKMTVLAFKLEFSTEAILILVGLFIPFCTLAGIILLLTKTEKDLPKSLQEKYQNKTTTQEE